MCLLALLLQRDQETFRGNTLLLSFKKVGLLAFGNVKKVPNK